MARTTTVSQYRTAGGAALTVELTTGLLTVPTVTSDCGGCRGGLTRRASDYCTTEEAQAAVEQWAAEHADTCRRIPTQS